MSFNDTKNANTGSKPIKLLIVEDEVELLHSISFVLKRQGYEVYTSSGAECALVKFSNTTVTPYDLIITDIQLPGLSGIEFIDSLRDRGFQIPFLVITAYKGFEIYKALETRGIKFFLIKPFDTAELILKVKSALGNDLD